MATSCQVVAGLLYGIDLVLVLVIISVTGGMIRRFIEWGGPYWKCKSLIIATGGVVSTRFLCNYFVIDSRQHDLIWRFAAKQIGWRDARKIKAEREQLSDALRDAGFDEIASEQNPVTRSMMMPFEDLEGFPFGRASLLTFLEPKKSS